MRSRLNKSAVCNASYFIPQELRHTERSDVLGGAGRKFSNFYFTLLLYHPLICVSLNKHKIVAMSVLDLYLIKIHIQFLVCFCLFVCFLLVEVPNQNSGEHCSVPVDFRLFGLLPTFYIMILSLYKM